MIDATLPRGLPYPQVATSVPFTFRDGLTTLELIERLRHCLLQLQTDVNTADGQTQANMDALKKTLDDAVASMTDAMAALDKEMRALVHESVASGVVVSPVRGEVQPVQAVLDDLYDNVRVFALFSADYDGLGLSAEEYDGLGMTSRVYDLHATDIVDATLGDFTDGRAHFPAGRPVGGTPLPDSGVYLTKADAEATYMTLHPDVEQFEPTKEA